MIQLHPNFDIEIGDVDFGTTRIDSPDSSKPMYLLDLVQKIVINKNLDKTATKGKKRVKTNTCDVVISNPRGQLDNILRLGRKVTVWLGFGGDDEPLVRVGHYTLYKPKWVYPRNGMPTVHFQAKAGDIALWYDWTPRTFTNMTHSDAVRKIAKERGLLVDIEDTKEKTTLIKSLHENEYDAIARWAYDCGKDFYVDDKTFPNTLVWKKIVERPMTSSGGKKLTIGWGPGTQATLPAAELTIEHNYPDPTGGMQVRDKMGALFTLGGAAGVAVQAKLPMANKNYAELYSQGPGTANPGGFGVKAAAASAAAQLAKQVDCVFDPGVPFFELGRSVPLVGMHDNDRNYRILDITHEITGEKYTTRIKMGVMAGTGKPKPGDVGPAINAVGGAGGVAVRAKVGHGATGGRAVPGAGAE